MAPALPDVLPFPNSSQASDTQEENVALPSPFPLPVPRIPPFRSLRAGSWLLSYQPLNSRLVAYDGTLRVEIFEGGRRASGDLYQRETYRLPIGPPWPPTGAGITLLRPPPNPADGIPILPIKRYTYFLRVTKILESFTFGNSFTLGLEMHRFSHTAWSTATPELGRWVESFNCTSSMRWVPDATPAGFPSRAHYLEGSLRHENGTLLGNISMGWLSDIFRKVTVEIDTVPSAEEPLDSGAGQDWATVGTTLGYDIKGIQSSRNVQEPSGFSWAYSELHPAMNIYRDPTNLDQEWRYHVLAVKRIDETERGVMYDEGALDSNNVAREGLAVASDWTIPAGWGSSTGLRFGEAKEAYFRTAVHELGHALGLDHNAADNGFMCTSERIAKNGTAPGATPFPKNISWAFHPDDLKRLRHRPDIHVRPGGVPWAQINDTTPQPTPNDELTIDLPELQLELTPLLTEVPLGAPVRVEIKLTNTGDFPAQIPARIDLKSHAIRGWVTSSSGSCRSFKSIIKCIDGEPLEELAPGSSVTKSLTLLRGGEGALFPSSGVSAISIQLRWTLFDSETGPYPEAVVSANTTVFITAPVVESHAKYAHKLLTCPDMQLLLALGGCKSDEVNELVDAASQCTILGPHWSGVKAKSLARNGEKEYGINVLREGGKCVLSASEKKKLEGLLK